MTVRMRLSNASFSYGEKRVFSDVSFDLERGEVLSLLGPNGCGKTTLLRCLNGSLRLDQGSVSLNGRDTTSLGSTEVAKVMGFVFQEHTVLFPYPVLEVVRMGRAPHLGFFSSPSTRDTEIAHEALETVGILHLSGKPYNQISGGERQLALIARALAQQPEILLLDEPTSHLDFGNQSLILQTIRRLARESNLSVVMTTHFPNHAVLVSSRVVLMKGGGFIAVGAPEEVIVESNLKELYGVEVKVVSVDDGRENKTKLVVPVMASDHPGSR